MPGRCAQGSPSAFRHQTGRLLYHGCRLVLAAVFLVSGVTKAGAPDDFARIIEAYGLVPEPLVFPTAIVLIVAELAAAFGLLFEKRGALTLTSLMMLIFVLVLSYGIFLGLDIDCGCFGEGDPEAEAFHDLRGALSRDLLLAIAIVYMYLWRFFNQFESRPWFNFGRHQHMTKEV